MLAQECPEGGAVSVEECGAAAAAAAACLELWVAIVGGDARSRNTSRKPCNVAADLKHIQKRTSW